MIYFDAAVERAVLSGVMQDNTLYGTGNVRAGTFYDYKNRKVWEAIGSLIESGASADIMSVSGKLKGQVEVSHIANLDLPTASNWQYYVDKLLELYRKRVINTIKNELGEYETEDSFALRARIEAHFEDFSGAVVSNIKIIKNAVKPAISKIEELYYAKGKTTGIATKIDALDQMTAGFQPGNLIIIGARPSIGKTAFALTLLNNIAVKQEIPAGFFSCEMSEEEIMMRLFSMAGSVKLKQIRSGFLTDIDFAGIHNAAEYLYESPLWIDDTPNADLRYILSQCRYMKRQGVRIIFVDYLTLIRHGDMRMPRHERVGEISKQLKQIARELKIPVVAMSQVGREADGMMPTLKHVRQSGEIEEDADVIIFMHREEEGTVTEIKVAKNRSGETGTFELNFEKDYVRFGGILGKKEIVSTF